MKLKKTSGIIYDLKVVYPLTNQTEGYNTLKNLLFIQLNEINFDLALPYRKAKFRRVKKLLKLNKTITSSEEKYELLEPWIQWHSIH